MAYEMIRKSCLSCVDVVKRESRFYLYTAATRALQYYNGTLRPVRDGKNLRLRTKTTNEGNVKLSFQEVGPREKSYISMSNKLK